MVRSHIATPNRGGGTDDKGAYSHGFGMILRSMDDVEGYANKTSKVDKKIWNKRSLIDRENGQNTYFHIIPDAKMMKEKWLMQTLQCNKEVNGIRLKNGVKASKGEHIAYFHVVARFRTKKEADQYSQKNPSRYDYLKATLPLEYWVYDNFKSPASLINNEPSKNNCTIVGINKLNWDKKRVWVCASRNIPKNGHLWCAYGSGNGTHHNNRTQATAEIKANVKKRQRQTTINRKQTRAANSANKKRKAKDSKHCKMMRKCKAAIAK